MSIINCAGCGYETNTACSDYINRTDGMADVCYARLARNNMWEQGCGYDEASESDKAFARKVIGWLTGL
jgi:hypothetical protein